MNEPEYLVVTVHPDGTVSAVTRGVLGDRCVDYVTVLEDLLDAETTASEFTADRWRTADDVDTTAVTQTVTDRPAERR